ncbi:MAG: hypothetical protein KR126chlam3_01047 [Chlamydiae bacterium]|nr:hypothetical protein [Chlamydiota bacterium]
MKTLDVIVTILLVIGGLNWGLIGFFNFDLIGTVFGHMSAFTRLIYCLVGVSALYQIFQWKAIQQRWKRK